ncbi:MAG: DNA primase [Chloroflexota bacterium]
MSSSSGSVAEIKSKIGVLEVVGETVVLKRAGATYKGLCPFHGEKTPSFVVTPDRETWHCFGCGEHGDIFTFLMRRDGLDFREALTRLAERAGVELTDRSAREDRHKARLRDALEAAFTWYREVLLQAHQATTARAYLAERGLSDETLDRFGVGYAPNTWDALSKRLRARSFTEVELIGAGLVSSSNRGGVYDRFRGRIIIPIRDASGRAVGIGGRIMPGAEGPKYLNSPATPLFDKSRTLYAIDLAKAAIRREKLAVIVEGYTDVMAAHQAGFKNVVASLGTALTAGQVELATRYADGIALAYDVDVAGEAATQRGLLEELGQAAELSRIAVIRIPAGKDPDELIRTDADAWRSAVTNARPVMEYFIDLAVANGDRNSVAGRTAIIDRVRPAFRFVRHPAERAMYVQKLARLVDVAEQTLDEDLKRPIAERQRRAVPVEASAGDASILPQLPPLEAEALGLLLRYPDLGADGVTEEATFTTAEASALARAAAQRNGSDLLAFVEGLEAPLDDLARSVLAPLGAAPRLDPVSARETLRVCILRLRVLQLDERLRNGQALLRDAAQDDDRSHVTDIEHKIDRLAREREELNRTIHAPAPVAGGPRR